MYTNIKTFFGLNNEESNLEKFQPNKRGGTHDEYDDNYD